MLPKTVSGTRIDHSEVEMEADKLSWRPAAYAFIFNDSSEILALENPWNEKKELPGGGVEVWETLPSALIREVWEETGLHVEVREMVHVLDEFYMTPTGKQWHTLKFYYCADLLAGDLRGAIRGNKLNCNPQWVDPALLTPDDLTHGWEALQKARCLPRRPASSRGVGASAMS